MAGKEAGDDADKGADEGAIGVAMATADTPRGATRSTRRTKVQLTYADYIGYVASSTDNSWCRHLER